MPEKTSKRIKTIFFKILVIIYISELLNLGVKIMAPYSALLNENLPNLPHDLTIFFKLGLTLCKTEQRLRGHEK